MMREGEVGEGWSEKENMLLDSYQDGSRASEHAAVFRFLSVK